MDTLKLKNIVEAALLAVGGPLTIAQLQALFGDLDPPERKDIKDAIKDLQEDYAGRGVEIVEVASGFRIQVRESMSQWLTKLWEERPPRYSRALLETLAIVAYRQPVTRGDIEDIRGVGVTTNIIRTLLERSWIKVVGYRDVPGKPAMFSTTREFLDYFSLKKLDDLPPLAELAQLDPMGVQLELGGNPDEISADDSLKDVSAIADGGPDSEAAELDEEPPQAPDDGDEPEALLAASVDEDAADIDAGHKDTGDDYDEDRDLPPGAVEPLVGLRKPGEAPPEPATVASLDDARAAAAEQGGEPETDFHEDPAEVVPLKSS